MDRVGTVLVSQVATWTGGTVLVSQVAMFDGSKLQAFWDAQNRPLPVHRTVPVPVHPRTVLAFGV